MRTRAIGHLKQKGEIKILILKNNKKLHFSRLILKLKNSFIKYKIK